MTDEIYGIIPAAGKALRMRPLRYPKELLPIYYEREDGQICITPKLLIEHSLEAMSLVKVKGIFIIIPDWKPEIMRYIEDGSQFDQNISYLYNSASLGLSHALLSGYNWLKDKITLFSMPDTLFAPKYAFEVLLNVLLVDNADLVLGVFPTNEPEHLAPVEFSLDMKVIKVEDKPVTPTIFNTWGIAVWSPAFWSFFKSKESELTPGQSISDIFDAASKSNLYVKCVYFDNGWYRDIGKFTNIKMV